MIRFMFAMILLCVFMLFLMAVCYVGIYVYVDLRDLYETEIKNWKAKDENENIQ